MFSDTSKIIIAKSKLLANAMFLSIFLLLPSTVFAQVDGSGACSYHGGVNCDLSRYGDGTVLCSDGWRNSAVEYFSVQECFNTDKCDLASLKCSMFQTRANILMYKQRAEDDMSSQQPAIQKFLDGDALALNDSSLTAAQKQLMIVNDRDGLQAELARNRDQLRIIRSTRQFLINESTANPCAVDCFGQPLPVSCSGYGSNAYLGTDGKCYCNQGYAWNSSMTACVEQAATQCSGGSVLNAAGACVCSDGYFWDPVLNICSKIVSPSVIVTPLHASVVNEKKTKPSYVKKSITTPAPQQAKMDGDNLQLTTKDVQSSTPQKTDNIMDQPKPLPEVKQKNKVISGWSVQHFFTSIFSNTGSFFFNLFKRFARP